MIVVECRIEAHLFSRLTQSNKKYRCILSHNNVSYKPLPHGEYVSKYNINK